MTQVTNIGTTTQVLNVIVPLLAAIIGGLATAFFNKPKKPKQPTILFDTREMDAHIGKIGLDFSEGKRTSKIIVKSFHVKNSGPGPVSGLIVEYKNLKLTPDKFNIQNDPSSGLLESHYNVAFNEPRESLRYQFDHIPEGASFTSALTINDFWTIGGFQAYATDAAVLSSSEQAKRNEKQSVLARHRLVVLYVATVVTFVALISAITFRVWVNG